MHHKKWLSSLETQREEIEDMIEFTRATGGKVNAVLTSQLCLLGFLDSLNRGDWNSARVNCLTLAELLPEYPPSLRLTLR